jgi:hypothetical protein
MTIETVGNDHSANMDELLIYLITEAQSRQDLAHAYIEDSDRYKRESDMALHYERMYEAAKFYRKAATK